MPNLNTGFTDRQGLELQRRLDKAVKAVLHDSLGGEFAIKFMSGVLDKDKLQPTGEQLKIVLTYQIQPKDKAPV